MLAVTFEQRQHVTCLENERIEFTARYMRSNRGDTRLLRRAILPMFSHSYFFQSSFQAVWLVWIVAGQSIRLSLGGQSSLDPVPVRRWSDIGPSAGACEHRWWFDLEVVLTWDYNERWYCYRRPRALPSEHLKLVSIKGLPISA